MAEQQQPAKKVKTPEETAETLAGFGLKDEQIASYMGLTESVLQKRYAVHLHKGRAIANVTVINTAYQLATSGKCPAMTMFWLKCRARWREQDRVAEDGAAAPAEEQIRIYLPANGREPPFPAAMTPAEPEPAPLQLEQSLDVPLPEI